MALNFLCSRDLPVINSAASLLHFLLHTSDARASDMSGAREMFMHEEVMDRCGDKLARCQSRRHVCGKRG